MNSTLAFLLAALGLTALFTLPAGAAPDGFRTHMRFTGVGGCLKQLVGPGPEPGSQRLYAAHIYDGDILEIVAVDPATGKADVFPSPVPGEIGAWALALGADNQVYVGTLPTAHVFRVDWTQRKLIDLGRPSQTEQYIWQLALGADKKLYGCTYPNAKLVRFDPATGKGEDLGRMDPTEQYARSVAADDNGFVYVGIGPSAGHLVAYEIATGQHRDLLPPAAAGAGFASVHRGDDGRVYGRLNNATFRFDGWTATPIPAGEVRGEAPLRLADGRSLAYGKGTIACGSGPAVKVDYAGRSQSLFRIGLGPDGQLYGSTALPIHFFRADPDSARWEELGQPGGGEFYSFLAWNDVLLGAAYSGDAPLMVYRPGKPYAPAKTPDGNPWLVHFEGENSGWRPMALVAGTDGKAYLGAVAGYGLLGGPLSVYDPVTGKVEQFHHLIQDQSVVALAVLPDGRIVGGTTIGGGGGSHPTQTEAKLFVFDPTTKRKTFETTAVPGEGGVDALAVGGDGLVYGFAGKTLFVFDPKRQEIVKRAEHGLGRVVYNAVGPGPRGRLFGVSGKGVFTIDTRGQKARMLATYPDGIRGGFAIRGNRIYFTSGPNIVSYGL